MDVPASLRATRLGTFPPTNIGSIDDSAEIAAFAPGLDPVQIDALTDKGPLTISGGRRRPDFEMTDGTRVYADEHFTSAFRRAIELPQGVDPGKVSVRCVSGYLAISVNKSEASKPHQTTV